MLQRKTLHVYVSNRFLWILLKTLSHDFLSLTQASMMKMTSTTFLFFTFFSGRKLLSLKPAQYLWENSHIKESVLDYFLYCH